MREEIGARPLAAAFLALLASTAWAGDSTVPTDFATIQAAVDDAGTVNGDTITVLASASPLAEDTIHITKSITLAGEGIGSTILLPAGGAIGIYVDADDVTIRDLTILGGSQGMRFEKASGTISGTTLERVRFFNQTQRGIEIHNATTVSNLLVDDCEFEVTDESGLRVASSGHVDGAEFRDTHFLNNDIGIYHANDGGTSTFKNVLITGCTFEGHVFSQGTSIFLEEAQDVTIEDNLFLNNRRDIQIFKWYQAGVEVSNVLIRNNTMTGTDNAVLAIFNAEHSSGQTTFNGVTFENNVCDTADGSAVYAGGHAGVSAGGLGWDTVVVRCNDFLGITSAGNGVRFFNPGVPATEVLGGTQTIDVSGNWWGSSDLVTVSALMADPDVIEFEPYLCQPSADTTCPPPLAAIAGYGSGINPAGSLIPLTATLPKVGETLVLGVDNPLGTQAPGSMPILAISSLPDPAFPFGTLVPGWGMTGPGDDGELLINIAWPDPVLTLSDGLWAGPGTPAPTLVPVPSDCFFVGFTVYAQAVLVDSSPTAMIPIGITEALALTIGV